MEVSETKKFFKSNAYLDYKIWGGEKLGQYKNIEISDTKIKLGESWEVSTYKGKSSTLNNKSLDQNIDLPYLIKFLDTSDNLSVQVHPDDEYAKKYENEFGKDECWLILEHEENACIYIGLKKDVTKDEFYQTILNKGEAHLLLNKIHVKKGDFFTIPPGTIHAIGSGITLLEVQTKSGVTYRLWDWNRLDENGKARDLHVNKAIDVINCDPDFNQKIKKKKYYDLFNKYLNIDLQKFNKFNYGLIKLNKGESIFKYFDAFSSIVILEGELHCSKTIMRKMETYINQVDCKVKLTANCDSLIAIINLNKNN